MFLRSQKKQRIRSAKLRFMNKFLGAKKPLRCVFSEFTLRIFNEAQRKNRILDTLIFKKNEGFWFSEQ